MHEDVIYRPFREEDRDDVISVLMENYQFDYFHSVCYDGAQLVRANRDRSHALYVAVLPDGEFVGVVGAKFRVFFPQSYEMSLHMLRKKFHGQGMAKGLLRYCIQRSMSMHLTGVYGHCVTYQTVTQHEVAELGLTSTGLWPGRHLSNRSFLKAMGKELRSTKLHSLVVAKRGMIAQAGQLYCPKEHREFVASVYGQLGVACELKSRLDKGQNSVAPPCSQVEYWDNPQSANLDLFFTRIGLDLPKLLKAALRERRAVSHQSWSVFLNMQSPHTLWAYRECCKRGFYFTGIHPLHGGWEYLMLHREPPEGYAWEELELTPENRAIADYLIAHQTNKTAVRGNPNV